MFGVRSISAGKDTSASQVVYTTPGTYSWTAPPGVTSICVVCVGAGQKGGGGLGWKNSISVTPGTQYTVVVGDTTGNLSKDSYFINAATVKGGGANNSSPGTYVGDGGGNGGWGGGGSYWQGGGGAGGYSGNGGTGGANQDEFQSDSGTDGSGGGGGGGGAAFGDADGGPGGGVYLGGQGTSGAGGGGRASPGSGRPGQAGSSNIPGAIGPFGGTNQNGAVRIIWGAGRSFPSNAA